MTTLSYDVRRLRLPLTLVLAVRRWCMNSAKEIQRLTRVKTSGAVWRSQLSRAGQYVECRTQPVRAWIARSSSCSLCSLLKSNTSSDGLAGTPNRLLCLCPLPLSGPNG